MPEGDTIHRAAGTLHRALAGRTVTRFASVFPQLTRIDDSTPLGGRTITHVEARGKHLLIWFTGDLVLRTHMRMHGSWHIYRPGERWRRPGHEMRIVIETDLFHAIGFTIPVAEFSTSAALERDSPVSQLGPDPLDDAFDQKEAIRRLRTRGNMEAAEALLDQTAIAGLGNVYKSEVLFAARINPFRTIASLTDQQLRSIVEIAVRLLRANVPDRRPASGGAGRGITTYSGMRRTTGRADPSARLWVYGRDGEPCRRCGTPISRRKQGLHARGTYWCARCQPETG